MKEVILQGIVGSTAYGLNTEESDVDRLGIYLASNKVIMGIQRPQETIVTNNPDSTLHELGKFTSLALKCNPTVLEALFLDSYETLHPAGKILVDNRHAFLSRIIYKSYGGYARAQARRLNSRGDSFSSSTKNRTSKHCRHVFRLLQQGAQLLSTGELSVRVKNREELFALGELPVDVIITRFVEECSRFDALTTSLPDKPDTERINRIVLEIRETYG